MKKRNWKKYAIISFLLAVLVAQIVVDVWAVRKVGEIENSTIDDLIAAEDVEDQILDIQERTVATFGAGVELIDGDRDVKYLNAIKVVKVCINDVTVYIATTLYPDGNGYESEPIEVAIWRQMRHAFMVTRALSLCGSAQ